MNGKAKCKILKEIRREIAESNDIYYVVSECPHQGDCTGTCPRCEAEVAYLERELKKRQALGKTVLIAGLAVSIAAATAGCIKEKLDDLTRDITDKIPSGFVSKSSLQEEWEQPQADMNLQDLTAGAEDA